MDIIQTYIHVAVMSKLHTPIPHTQLLLFPVFGFFFLKEPYTFGRAEQFAFERGKGPNCMQQTAVG